MSRYFVNTELLSDEEADRVIGYESGGQVPAPVEQAYPPFNGRWLFYAALVVLVTVLCSALLGAPHV